MMQPANDPAIDYKALVRAGYDRAARAYAEARQGEASPELDEFTRRLSPGASVLDIGCGAGVPIAQALARQFQVTGVDLSSEQIRLARINVPREEHPELLRRMHGWLKPGGCLLATVAQNAEAAYTEDDFFGVTMYWSNYGLMDYQRMLAEIGFRLLDTSVLGHGYGGEAPAEQHPIIFAQVI